MRLLRLHLALMFTLFASSEIVLPILGLALVEFCKMQFDQAGMFLLVDFALTLGALMVSPIKKVVQI